MLSIKPSEIDKKEKYQAIPAGERKNEKDMCIDNGGGGFMYVPCLLQADILSR